MPEFNSIQQLVDHLDAVLRAVGTPERAIAERKYLKSDLAFYGCTVFAMRRAVVDVVKGRTPLHRSNVVAAAELLWSVPVHERRLAAAEWLKMQVRTLEPEDMALVERLLRESKTWALVDSLAPSIAGPLVVRYPELNATLDRWSVDDDFWIRRAALLSLLEPLRRGAGDWERFCRFAGLMLEEKEFFVRKAIGWILREVSKKRPQLVYEWIAPRADRASGVTMREVVRYLPAAQSNELMATYNDARRQGARARLDAVV